MRYPQELVLPVSLRGSLAVGSREPKRRRSPDESIPPSKRQCTERLCEESAGPIRTDESFSSTSVSSSSSSQVSPQPVSVDNPSFSTSHASNSQLHRSTLDSESSSSSLEHRTVSSSPTSSSLRLKNYVKKRRRLKQVSAARPELRSKVVSAEVKDTQVHIPTPGRGECSALHFCSSTPHNPLVITFPSIHFSCFRTVLAKCSQMFLKR